MPVEVARDINDREAAVMFGPVDPVFSVEEIEIPDGLRARIYRPSAEADLPVLVYFHGGGWVVGSLDSHDGVARFLCRFGRCVVVSVAYRLAPEHPFPAAVEDAWAATTWVAGNPAATGGDGKRLAVGGDSAGGNLAAVMARWARDRHVPLRLQLLVYPALDSALSPGGDPDEYGYWTGQYLGPGARAFAKDPDASPLRATELRGLAPVVILSCGLDPLRKQADDYSHRLSEADVPVEHRVYPGLIHGAYRMPGVLPGAREMLEHSAHALSNSFESVS